MGAIGALSGPLHGGAPSRALDMLDAIGTIDRAEPWLRDAVERGDRLMGFGHRVYKTDDPRSVMLRGVAERLGGDKVELAKAIESSMSSARLGAPPCSGPESAPIAPTIPEPRSAPVEVMTRAVNVDALKPWSMVEMRYCSIARAYSGRGVTPVIM